MTFDNLKLGFCGNFDCFAKKLNDHKLLFWQYVFQLPNIVTWFRFRPGAGHQFINRLIICRRSVKRILDWAYFDFVCGKLRTYDFQRVLVVFRKARTRLRLHWWLGPLALCRRSISSKICYLSQLGISKSKVFTKEELIRENVTISS